jgi:hypothetical protein
MIVSNGHESLCRATYKTYVSALYTRQSSTLTKCYGPDFMVLTWLQGSDRRGDLTSIPYFDTPISTPGDPFCALSVHAMDNTIMRFRVRVHRHIQSLRIPKKDKKFSVPTHPRIQSSCYQTSNPPLKSPVATGRVESEAPNVQHRNGVLVSVFEKKKKTKQLERVLKRQKWGLTSDVRPRTWPSRS